MISCTLFVDLSELEANELFSSIIKQDLNLNDDQLTVILNSKNRNKVNDFEAALKYLEESIKKHHLHDATNSFLSSIKQAREEAPIAELPLLTELTYRTAVLIEKPKHQGNQVQGLAIAKKIQQHSWGRIVASVATGIFALACAATFMGCLFLLATTFPPAFFVAIPPLAKSFLTVGSAILTGVFGTASGAILAENNKQTAGRHASGLFHHQNLQQAKDQVKPVVTNPRPTLRRSASF